MGIGGCQRPQKRKFLNEIIKIVITQPFLKFETSDFEQKYIWPSHACPYNRVYTQKYHKSTFGVIRAPYLDFLG